MGVIGLMNSPHNVQRIKTKVALICVAVTLAFVSIGLDWFLEHRKKKRLEILYPTIEESVAIYSLLAWVDEQQSPPDIEENEILRGSGSVRELQCKSVDWKKHGLQPEALFNCFLEKRIVYIPVAQKEFETSNVIQNEDIWTKFDWTSLFGYTFSVEINPDGGDYEKRQELWESCIEETGSECPINIYVIRIYLDEQRSIDFMAASGEVVSLMDGSIDIRQEWVIHMDGKEAMDYGELNRKIQVALRELGISETNLYQAIPELQTLWLSRDETYLQGLIRILKRLSDLVM